MKEETTDGYRRRRLLQAAGATAMLGTSGCIARAIRKENAATTFTYADREDTASLYATNYNEATDGLNADFSLTDGRYRDTITKVKAGAKIPGVMGLDIVRYPYFAELNVLSDISEFYQSLSYREDFLGDVSEIYSTYDGKRTGVPFWLDSSLYFYNRNHFEQAGLDPDNPPATWSAFRDALETLDTELDKNRPPLGAAFTTGLAGFFGYPFVWANGGRILNQERTEAVFDETPSVEALEYWVGINDSGLMTNPLSTNWSDWHSMFANGQLSIIFTGGLGLASIQGSNPDLFNNALGTAMFPKPEGGTRSSFLGGNNLTITTSLPDDDRSAAENFLRWVNTEEGMRTTWELGFMPGRERGFNIGIATEQPYDRLLEAYRRTLEQGQTPKYPNYEEIDLIFTNAWSRALSGGVSPKRALAEAAAEVNREVLDDL